MKRQLALVLAIAALAACASPGEETPPAADAGECTHLDAALKDAGRILALVPDIQTRAVEDCGHGDARACIATPGVAPFTALVGTFYAPFGFPIGLSFEERRNLCTSERRLSRGPKRRAATPGREGDCGDGPFVVPCGGRRAAARIGRANRGGTP